MNWVARGALTLALVAATALAFSGPGMRLGLWPYQGGLVLLLAAGIGGLAASALAAVGLCIARIRRAGFSRLLVALLVGAGSAAFPLEFLRQALAVPPINDISTDLANPASAGEQRKAYPDIQPLLLPDPPDKAYARAIAAGQSMGWEIRAADAAAGRFTAVATSAWFGFSDDVEVRVAPAAQGSRIDVRSKSRVGRSDIGANARRIRTFSERMK